MESTKNLHYLATLVKSMRDAQKTFFGKAEGFEALNAKRDALVRSKQLEKQVDQAIDDILNPKPRTGDLFPED